MSAAFQPWLGVGPRWLVVCAMLGVLLGGCAGRENVVDNGRAAEANANLGADFLRKNDNEMALTKFRRALSYDNDNVSANWGMAIVNARLGENDKARSYYRKVLDLQPGPAIFNSYGVFLCNQGEPDRGVGYLRRAAKDPRFAGKAGALANAGLCLYRAGRPDDAERYFREALAADDDQITALTDMARLKYDQQDYLRARAFVERADAASDLNADQLLLGARIELALGDREAAGGYLERHNASQPSASLSLRQLEQSR